MKRNVPADRKKRGGFTMAETLMVCIILLFVTGISATGFPSIRTAYSRVVDTANAQVLLSTTLAVLRSELDLCTDVTLPDTHTVEYYNTKEQQTRRLEFTETPVKAEDVKIDVIDTLVTPNSVVSSFPLVNKSTATPTLRLCFDTGGGFESGSGVIIIKNLQVTDRDGYQLASVSEYKIQTLNLRTDTP